MRALALVFVVLLGAAPSAARAAPPSPLKEACALIDFAATDALLGADWYVSASRFLQRACADDVGARAAMEKACSLLVEAGDDGSVSVCKAAREIARQPKKPPLDRRMAPQRSRLSLARD